METLKAGNPVDMPAEIKAAIANAPNLEEVVIAEFSDGRPAAARKGSGVGGFDPSAVGVDVESFPDDQALEAF
jgi:hypothetical protein